MRWRLSQFLLSGVSRDLCLESVASKLKMTPRTLQRRLKAEGTSYRAVIEDFRRHVATQTLSPPATASELAKALGFGDVRAFHRAFKRWTGTSRGEFLSRVLRS